jgi:flagellin
VSLRINTNIMAMNALRNLATTDAEMAGTITRLSSGLRINSAADDPSGLIISEGMRAQIKGIRQALANSQDAVNMAKTADAALDEVQRLLREIRAVAVHAANSAVVDSAQLQADQADIASAIQSINRIADQTSWGNRKLLNGTAGVMANITDATRVLGAYFGGTFANLPVAAGAISVNVTTAATQSTWTAATAYSPTATVGAGSFVLNGYTFQISATDTLANVMEKINNQSGNTGVVASINGSNQLVLRSIQYGANYPITLFDPSNRFGAATNVTGVNAQAIVTVPTVQPDGTTAATTAGMPRAATAACARRDAQGRCLRPATATPRWQTGLPPMTMAQQECPPGTVATLARGHADVVRCLPI